MAIIYNYFTAASKSEGRPTHCVCDTVAELPASGLTIGDTAYCKETGYFYKATGTSTWTNQGSGAGATAFSDLTGTASVAQGGTGAANAPEARTNLGLGALAVENSVAFSGVTGSVALGAQSGNLALSYTSGTLAIVNGGTGQSNAPSARTALGLGSLSTANSVNLATDTSGTLSVASGGTGQSNATDARTALGLGSLATQNGTFSGTSSGNNSGDVSLSGTPDYITISGQVITRGDVDLASDITGTLSVARGGTGQANASSARTALGVGDVGTLNTNASTVNFLRGDGQWITPSAGSVAASDITGSLSLLTQSGQLRLADGVTGTLSFASGGTGASNAADARTALGLGSLATQSSVAASSLTGSLSLGAQSGDLQLTDVTGTLAVANGGTNAANAADARTNLGLGSIATLSSVTLVTNTAGTLSVAQGGTGASSGSAAYTNLGAMTASNLSGTVSVANGGTGQSNKTVSFNVLSPTTTQGDMIYHDGTNNVRLAKGTANQEIRMNSGATAPEWYTPSAGGTFTTAKQTADQGNSSSTTAASPTQLSLGVAASTDYLYEVWPLFQTAATTTGARFWLDGPADMVIVGTGFLATSAIGMGMMLQQADNASVTPASASAFTGNQVAYMTGFAKIITAGTLRVMWTSEVNASMTTIKAGSAMRIMSI